MAGLPEYVRAFTAVELDPEIRDAVGEDAARLLDRTGRVSLTAVENLHVTLKFIGDVHREDLPALDEVVSEAAKGLTVGEFEVTGIGAFPGLGAGGSGRPRVIWAGVSDPEGILTPVQAQLNETLARFGAKREKKRYVPHVTVARVRGSFDSGLFSRRLEGEEFWFGAQEFRSVTLFMSELGGPSGHTRYTVLGHYGPVRK